MADKNSKKTESQNKQVVDQSTEPVSLSDIVNNNAGTVTTPIEYQQSENQPTTSQYGEFNQSEYSKYISNPNPAYDSNLDLERSLNQPTSEKLGHTLVQFGANVLGGALMSAGISTDVAEGVKTALGQENQYENALYDYGSELMQNAQSNYPIYQQNNDPEKGKFSIDNLSDPSFWMNQFSQTGLSLGIMGYSMLEAGIIGGLTGGIGEVAEVTNDIKKASTLEKIFSATKNSDKLKRNATIYALVNRHNESVMEATQTFQDTYKELLEKGVSEDKAREAASKGAALDYRLNIPLALADAVMMQTMLYNPVTKSGTGVMERLLGKINNPVLATAAKFGTEIASEGYEEYHQQIAQNEGQYLADKLAGVKQENSFGERLSQYNQQADVINSAIGGMLGGVVLGSGGEVFRHLSESSASKSLKQQHADFIKNTLTVNVDLANQIRKAEDNSKPLLANSLRKQAAKLQALESLHLDNLLDRTSAYDGYVLNLQELINAANTNDVDKLKELGVTDENSIEQIKIEFPKYLQDAKDIKDLYDVAKETIHPSALLPIVNLQHNLKVTNEEIANITPEIETLKSKIPDFNNLSADGRFIYEAKMNVEALNNAEKQTLEQLSTVEQIAEKSGLTEKLVQIRNQRVKYSNLINEISTDPERYTPQDRSIIAAIPEQKKLQNLNTIKAIYDNQLTNYRKQLEVWNNSSFQKANNEDKYQNIIAKTDDENELLSLKKSLTIQKQLTSKLNKAITDKLESIKQKKTKQEIIDVNNGKSVDNENKSIIEKAEEQDNKEEEIKPVEQPISTIRQNIATQFPFGKPVGVNEQDLTGIKDTNEAIVVEEETLFENKEEDYDTLFDPTTNKANDEQKKHVQNQIKEYHDDLSKELGRTLSFKDLLEDFINNSSLKHTKSIYNMLRYGWEANKYEVADYDKIYKEVFENRKEIARQLINWGVTNNTLFTNSLVDEENTHDTTNDEETIQIPFLQEGFRTSKSTLKLAYLHRPYLKSLTPTEEGINVDYEDIGDEFENNNLLNSNYILNPDSLKAGSEITIKLEDSVGNVPVSKWNKKTWEREKGIFFNDWIKENNIEVGSEEYIAKIPIFIYAKDSVKPIALVHDLDWYNPSNVGLGETPAIQQQLIKEARQELLELRKAIYQSKELNAEIVPTEKATGQKWILKDKITINQANSDSQIGFGTDAGNILTINGVINASQLINANSLKVGGNYDLRRWRTDRNGNPTYMALEVNRNKLTEQAQMSVSKALQAYLMQETNDVNIKQEVNKIRNEVKNITGLDIFNSLDLNTYLNHFIHTEGADFGTGNMNEKLAKISAYVATRNIPTNTPIITIHKGAVIIGKKGVNVNGKSEFMYAFPGLLKTEGQGKDIVLNLLQKFHSDGMVNAFYQNVSKQSLQSNKNMAFINADGKVTKGENYHDYLKNNFKTNIKSFNSGTKENPIWSTAYQPVINFKWAGTKEKEEGQVHEQIKQKDTIAPVELPSDRELLNLGLTKEEIEELRKATGTQSLLEPSYSKDTDDLIRNVKQKLTSIAQLNTTNRSQLVRFIARKIEAIIDVKYKAKIEMSDVQEAVKDSFENIFGPKERLLNQTRQLLLDRGLTIQVAIFDRQLANINIVRENYDVLIKEALEKEVYKYTGLTPKTEKSQEEYQEEDQNEQQEKDNQVESDNDREKNYSKTSLEENSKSSVTYVMKRFLAQIPLYTTNGEEKLGFLGVTDYAGFDYYYNLLGRMLSDVKPDFDIMINELEKYRGKQAWIGEFINRIKTANGQVKNSFVNGLALHGVSTNQVMFGENRKTGKKTLKVYEANANELVRAIQEEWYQAFNHSNLVHSNIDGVGININKTQLLFDQFNTWKFNKNPTLDTLPKLQEAKKWLEEFGVTLSNDTVRELLDKGYWTEQSGQNEHMTYAKMFRNSHNSNGIFGLLANKLQLLISLDKEGKSTDFEEDETLHPLNDVSGVFNKIANIEKTYNTTTSTNSHRDGDKNIYDLTPNKLLSQLMTELTTNQNYRTNKLAITFDKQSYLLNLINQIESLGTKLKLSHGAINILKEFGKKNFSDTEMNTLSDKDHEYVKVGMFQDVQQGKSQTIKFTIGEKEYELPFRMATLLFPTMSDKKMTLNLRMPILTINKKSFNYNEETNELIGLRDDVKDFVFSQIVKPELDRIIAHHTKAKELGVNPDELLNQKGVNKGRQIFHFIPEMNNIMFEDEQGNSTRLIQYIAENADLIGGKGYEYLLSKVQGKIYSTMDDLINHLVNNKIDIWKKNGYLILDNEGEINSNSELNQSYLDTFEEKDAKNQIKIAATDFVVNYLIGNANFHMLFDGDIANYSQDKVFKKDLFTDSKPYLAKSNETYLKITEQIDVNLGKRLAMMIAPGKFLANSVNDKYIQLFLQDQKTHSTNIAYLIKLFYSEQSKAVNDLIADVDNIDETKSKPALAALSDRFPKIADYFDIESTDAQEYMTAKEALDIIYRQGKMTEQQYNSLSEKIKLQKRLEKNGSTIPKEVYLTDKELKLVFNPIKPVYSSINPEVADDNSRVTYIKSSSFLLLPQFTLGTELDKLRRKMEELEDRTNHNVRASYDTANKVGSVLRKNQIKIWDNKGNFINNSINIDKISSELMTEGTTNSAMILDRENFRIQQDVPFKAAKKKADTISIGTQMMKEIFGDGVAQIADKIFDIDGQQYNGKELLNHYNSTFVNWISNEKSKLYEDLGINDVNGQPTDITKTVKKLQDILVEEVTKRGYPRQDIEALGVQHIEKDDKIIGAEFIVPLWLSPNSNRYEALLNAIVANRLMKLKLPGNSFVVGSQEGFKLSEDINDLSKENQSKIVYTNKFTGELKAAYTEDDKLIKAQVLVRSTFRNSKGELIDLSNPKYSTKDENGRLILKPEIIDEELLSQSSFRIPTSGLVSMSQIEIVGILPMEAGDLLIVPKNFTKQKGLDFDVDKENVYQLWHKTNEDGKIEVLTGDINDEDRNIRSKLLQNQLVKVYSAILSSSDDRIQQKIQRVLSMDFARGQAELLQSLTTESNKYFTPLSDEYQKYKMGLGSAGKIGIGIYSNYVVLHSLIQQSDKSISLMQKVFNGEKMVRIPLETRIGDFTAFGKLGNLMTLDGSRSIADVNAERQNTATDNEKEQIMGRAHINELTINVDAILVQLGFDKAKLKNKEEISIPYFLLSQPIIKDYVNEIRKAKSITSEFDKNAEQKVLDKLYLKYGGNLFKQEDDSINDIRYIEDNKVNDLRTKLIAQNLYDNITTPTNELQQTVLHLFTELNSYSDTIASLQNKLNIQKTGLGKSAFEMMEKYSNVEWFQYNEKVNNIDSLVGKFMSAEKYEDSSKQDLHETGYIDFGEFAIKPTTPVGSILIQGVKAGFELWSGFFPHTNETIFKELNQIVGLLGEDLKERKRIELKQEIFNELKKYLFSSERLGLFTGNPQQDRDRLFFDRKGNQSLASYLNILKNNEEFKDIVKNNKLLSSFTYKLEKNILPSLVKYNNTDSEDFNEEYKYLALIELMDAKAKLPDYNGQEYDTRKLAKDLIVYTYLSGGIQKAIEFIKYIPIAYLQEIGFADITRTWQQNANNPISLLWKQILGFVDKDTNSWAISRFAKQYIQHNPERVPKITTEIMSKKTMSYSNGKKLYNLTSFEIQDEASPKAFVSIYNKDIKKGNKFQLYQYDGQKYNRVPILGTFGMSEYSIKSNEVTPLVDQLYVKGVMNNEPVKSTDNQLPKVQGRETLFDINKGNLKATLKLIEDADISNISAVSKLLEPFIKNIDFEIGDLTEGRAQYQFSDNHSKIVIDRAYLNDKYTTDYMVARTILHEVVHSVTARELSKYFNKDSSLKVPFDKLPSHITKLHRVFAEVQRKMAKEIAELQEYYNKEEKGKLNKESDRLAYGAMSIFEFTAMIMSEPEFQQKMDTFRYRQTDNTILEQFVQAIKELLEVVGINFKKDSLAVNGIDATIKLIEGTIEKKKEIKNPFGNIQNNIPNNIMNLLNEDSKINASDFIGHSGAADGSDKYWREIAKKYNIGKWNDYLATHYDSLPENNKQEIELAYKKAVKDLGRVFLSSSSFGGKLVRRDYIQVKKANTTYAIGSIIAPNEKDKKGYTNKTNNKIISGGTGYAVQMAINMNKEVFIFDQTKNQWFKWQNNDFIQVETPTLNNNFAGIGTRELNENGKKAIEQVFKKTFNQFLQEPQIEDWTKKENKTDCIF